jgi:hypothetical protein
MRSNQQFHVGCMALVAKKRLLPTVFLCIPGVSWFPSFDLRFFSDIRQFSFVISLTPSLSNPSLQAWFFIYNQRPTTNDKQSLTSNRQPTTYIVCSLLIPNL